MTTTRSPSLLSFLIFASFFTTLNTFSSFANASAFLATDKNFDSSVLGSDKNVFVKFLAPWCGHCKSMKPAWDKLASKYKDHQSVMIVDVDCTAEGEKTCQKMGVQGYPTIKYFLAGDKKGKDYQQGRDFDSMLAFTKKTLDVEKCDVKTKKACKPNEIALIEKFDGKTSADIAEELKKRSEELKTIKSDMKAAKLEHNTKVATWKKREAALNKGEAILKQLEQLRKKDEL